MAVVGEKLDMHPRIGQSAYCGLGHEPFFLGQWIRSTLLMTHERLSRTRTTRMKCTSDVRRLVRKACVMCIRFTLQDGYE
jgi:hypothetical protein